MLRNIFAVSLLGSAAWAAAVPAGSSSKAPQSATPSAASPSNGTTGSVSSAAQASNPTRYVHFDCDTTLVDASKSLKDTISVLHEHSKTTASSKRSVLLSREAALGQEIHARAVSSIAVDMYAHVVESRTNAGKTTPVQIAAQIAAMNTAYKPYGISFNLRGADYTVNDAWAVGATSQDDLNMKTSLRQGTYSTLNIYFQSDLAGGVLGRCTLPTDIGTNTPKSTYAVDGCNIAAGTVPNGPITGYNLGGTAVHETGHWLGLLHTFEGYSCTGDGDFVADTPAESVSTDGCPVSPWKNSCAAARAGVDPIHNYMDYSTDACYTRFTPGQQTRMLTLWPQFRQGK